MQLDYKSEGKPALFSIHDVMPHTLERVLQIITLAGTVDRCRFTLLVVPGLDWNGRQLDILRSLVDGGHELAGHGWKHRCEKIAGVWHRLHSAVLSRDVAEHLSLNPRQEEELICRCGDWFESRGFSIPPLYVPPAWALGNIARVSIRRVPFSMIETISGVRHCRSGRKILLPLAGFEADTLFRQWSLKVFNGINILVNRAFRIPLRISIHPDDLQLRQANSLRRLLQSQFHSASYRSLFPAGDH